MAKFHTPAEVRAIKVGDRVRAPVLGPRTVGKAGNLWFTTCDACGRVASRGTGKTAVLNAAVMYSTAHHARHNAAKVGA